MTVRRREVDSYMDSVICMGFCCFFSLSRLANRYMILIFILFYVALAQALSFIHSRRLVLSRLVLIQVQVESLALWTQRSPFYTQTEFSPPPPPSPCRYDILIILLSFLEKRGQITSHHIPSRYISPQFRNQGYIFSFPPKINQPRSIVIKSSIFLVMISSFVPVVLEWILDLLCISAFISTCLGEIEWIWFELIFFFLLFSILLAVYLSMLVGCLVGPVQPGSVQFSPTFLYVCMLGLE